MRFTDRLSIDGTRRTADGYLVVNARVARGGNVQTYAGYEVGKPDTPVVNVYRPADEVFAKDALSSLTHKPVTLGHPADAVTADNWRSTAKGWTEGEVARDGDFVRLSMLLADAETIRAVEDGTREISLGYECELIWGDGVSPSGQAYQARQTRIRGNHVAIVGKARGGPELKIGDAGSQTERKPLHMMTDSEKRGMRDSVPTMSVADAAKLPIYDDVRGLTVSGIPGEEYYATIDGAGQGDAFHRGRAALDHSREQYDARLSDRSAHNMPVGDNGQAGYEKRVTGAWKQPAGDVFADREAAFAELMAHDQTAHVRR